MRTGDRPGPAADLAVGSVRGFRWWKVTPDLRLLSLCRGNVAWEMGTNVARCLGRRHVGRWTEAVTSHPRGVPELRCTCGFYAMLDPFADCGIAGNLWPIDPAVFGAVRSVVFGVAEGYGRVLLGRYGWRAERARTLALYVPSGAAAAAVATATATRYGVPLSGDLDAFVHRWMPEPWVRDLASGTRAA